MIPVRSSRLPTADELIPYLREIDDSRWYSNFGRLLQRFEARLADHFGVDPSELVCVNNGTSGLILALHAMGVRWDSVCAMPSWTFSATPAAARWVGQTPLFVDVGPSSWALDPDAVRELIGSGERDIGSVIPVAPLGTPVDPDPWEALHRETGIPVVIDAAWAFEGTRAATVPTMVSLHATKVFGIGEGGVLISKDRELIARMRRLSNFGFGASRMSEEIGANFKMSEFSAAIGLAMFDRWPGVRSAMAERTRRYRDGLSRIAGVEPMPGFGDGWVGALCCVRFDAPVGERCVDALAESGYQARMWWSVACHLHPAYRDFPRVALPTTEWLIPRVVGLPFSEDLTDESITEILGVVEKVAGAA